MFHFQFCICNAWGNSLITSLLEDRILTSSKYCCSQELRKKFWIAAHVFFKNIKWTGNGFHGSLQHMNINRLKWWILQGFMQKQQQQQQYSYETHATAIRSIWMLLAWNTWKDMKTCAKNRVLPICHKRQHFPESRVGSWTVGQLLIIPKLEMHSV